MRKAFLLLAMLPALVACQTTSGTNTPANVVNQVITGAQSACGFAPTANTVLAILGTFTGQAASTEIISTIINGICGTVTNLPRAAGRRSAARPTYRGVPVTGQFVR